MTSNEARHAKTISVGNAASLFGAPSAEEDFFGGLASKPPAFDVIGEADEEEPEATTNSASPPREVASDLFGSKEGDAAAAAATTTDDWLAPTSNGYVAQQQPAYDAYAYTNGYEGQQPVQGEAGYPYEQVRTQGSPMPASLLTREHSPFSRTCTAATRAASMGRSSIRDRATKRPSISSRRTMGVTSSRRPIMALTSSPRASIISLRMLTNSLRAITTNRNTPITLLPSRPPNPFLPLRPPTGPATIRTPLRQPSTAPQHPIPSLHPNRNTTTTHTRRLPFSPTKLLLLPPASHPLKPSLRRQKRLTPERAPTHLLRPSREPSLRLSPLRKIASQLQLFLRPSYHHLDQPVQRPRRSPLLRHRGEGVRPWRVTLIWRIGIHCHRSGKRCMGRRETRRSLDRRDERRWLRS